MPKSARRVAVVSKLQARAGRVSRACAVPIVWLSLCSAACHPRGSVALLEPSPGASSFASAAVPPAPPPPRASARSHAAGPPSEALALRATRTEHLASSAWPEADYAVHSLELLRPGFLSIGYRFERMRPGAGAPEVVERVFLVEVVARGAARSIVLGHPHSENAAVGDRFEVPVPLADPWGELRNFAWLPDAAVSKPGPWEPGVCAPVPAAPPRVEPQLVDLETRCVEQLRADLRTRTDVWFRGRAAEPGRAAGLPLEVRAADAALDVRAHVWTERQHGPSESSMTQVDRDVVVIARAGDTVLFPM